MAQLKGDEYGTQRVIEPKGALPQSAIRLDNDFTKVYDNEIVCDVTMLNIDSASFTDIKEKTGSDPAKIAEMMMEIVAKTGKHQNPTTGSGGMFIGTVKIIGDKLKGKIDLAEGDKIASLVSLTLTPLQIDKIVKVHVEKDQVEIKGRAVLFEKSVWVRLPSDIPQTLALALLDVSGAPAQTDRLVNSGDTVAVLGAGGKSGLLCCYQAKLKAGPDGRVIAIDNRVDNREELDNAPFIDDVIIAPADQPLKLLQKIKDVTASKLCDVVINCVSRSNCEMGAILITKQKGKVYFFSMATSFTKAALGAEGVGKDIDMIIGNGYCEGHAKLTLNVVRESRYLRDLYTKRYSRGEMA